MSDPVITEGKIREVLLRVYGRNYGMPEAWVKIDEAAAGAGLFVVQAKHAVRILEDRKMLELKSPSNGDWEIRLTSRGVEEGIRLQKPFLIRWVSDKETRKTIGNMTLGAIISGFIGYLFYLLGK
jgi:hypothetical protein